MIKIVDLEVTQLFLFKEQSHLEFHELSDEQRNAFMSDVAKVAKAIVTAYNPDKINYGAYADTISHLHMHIVPKYEDGFGFGGVFEMNPQKTYLSETEYKEIIDKIKAGLK
jgi:diadenosine tetraphosphate (Ap4A) HIT family hydrolase